MPRGKRAKKSYLERIRETSKCLSTIGFEQYEPQDEPRPKHTPDHHRVPKFGPIENSVWMHLAEKEQKQYAMLEQSAAEAPAAGAASGERLDQEEFVRRFRQALEESETVDLKLDDEILWQLAVSADQQEYVNSFDDFIFFDFTHWSMDEVEVTVRKARQLETFRDECAQKSDKGLVSFKDARFKQYYVNKDQIRAKNREAAWELVKEFLMLLGNKPGFSVPAAGGGGDCGSVLVSSSSGKVDKGKGKDGKSEQVGIGEKQSERAEYLGGKKGGGKGSKGGSKGSGGKKGGSKGGGRHEMFEEVHASNFLASLQLQLHKEEEEFESAGCNPLNFRHSKDPEGWAAAETLVRLWTSTNLCTPLQREFCSLLQAAMRLNDPELTPVLARIWATMNVFCLSNRKSGADRLVVWPGEAHPVTRKPPPAEEELRVLHRGGRLHPVADEWWEDACYSKEVFRVPGAVAVSKLAKKALTFMHRLSRPKDAPKAYFRFHLVPGISQPCDHAVCLDAVSEVPEEQEFLFPPFSAFQAISKEWHEEDGEEYWVINIKVMKNNQEVSDMVPLCPWI